ncbi:MAG TPA: nucleotidyltransferase domain-containing protein, partial [bacterium]|nr:nucleotidyltransferase domain-containing protein [bacterium]
KDTSKRPLDRQVEVAAISQPSLATNFIIYTPEEFRKQQENGNFFVVEEILKRGEVLYER